MKTYKPEYKPDKRAPRTLRVLIVLISLVLIAIVRFYVPVDILDVIFGTAICTVAIFFMYIYIPLYFKSLRYTAADNGLTRTAGVFLKSYQTVRFSAVQYYTRVTTPLSRITGLNFIVLYVYGGQFQLLYLSHDDVEEIIERIANGGGAS